ncbi:hypothetical protein Clacol_004032 [Clathrus columnatus]|uniref:Mediator of RNA polymerase II transcription subunit 7 n=1 Tax=Clathrus columnatus TaxID=1419009 RepID=A0AAV5AB10_9AGAM|nr:hypothetical protein Clacol_004032 [Clathrus columnatus]
MEDEQTLQNPFPSPPSLYVNYTSHNLHLLSLFKVRLEASGESIDELEEPDIIKKQLELLAGESDIPDWPLTQLEKPRVDWINEDGYYNVYGDTWFTKETIPSLKETGGVQLYPEDPTVDRRPALKSILTTMLYTYSSFLSSIVAPPTPPYAQDTPPDWHRLLEWIRVMGQNLIAAANDLRPVQARANLEAMMDRQLKLRQEETMAINAKCDELEAKLNELLQRANGIVNTEKPSTSRHKSDFTKAGHTETDALFDEESPQTSDAANNINLPNQTEESDNDFPTISQEDLRRWAEGGSGG